jgi:hypothetical protein
MKGESTGHSINTASSSESSQPRINLSYLVSRSLKLHPLFKRSSSSCISVRAPPTEVAHAVGLGLKLPVHVDTYALWLTHSHRRQLYFFTAPSHHVPFQSLLFFSTILLFLRGPHSLHISRSSFIFWSDETTTSTGHSAHCKATSLFDADVWRQCEV